MAPLPLGAFVWTNFPFGFPAEARSRLGPSQHIAYHIGSNGELVFLAYTSSGSWRGGTLGRPPGIVGFDLDQARAVNQIPFHLDLRTLAKVTLTNAWFPFLHRPDQGTVGVADRPTQLRIIEEARALAATSPLSIETRGIGSSTTTVTRRATDPGP